MNAERPWPPLIIADTTPRWILWRDRALTLVMWILFAILLDSEFELFFGRYLEHWGLGEFHTEANWAKFFERLLPFVLVVVGLVAALIVAGLVTLRRRQRGLRVPEPPPLGITEQARRAGMDEASLAASRELRVAVVYIDADGTHRVKPR